MRKVLLLAVPLAILAGCASNPFINTVETKETFNSKEASYILKNGNSTIEGNAFLKQSGGGIVTCAGNEVNLIPVNAYSTERINSLYKDGFASAYTMSITVFDPEHPQEYIDNTRKTMCNSEGKFEFKNVPRGEYYVQVPVYWKVGYQYQGGGLVEKVSVKSNDNISLIMSR